MISSRKIHLLRNYAAFTILLLLVPFLSRATHIVGGSLTYVYNGGSSYTFTLKLYRDCTPSTAQFPNTVTIAVRGYNGATFSPSKDFTMNLGTVTGIPSNLDTCAAPPSPMPCVQEGIYTTTVTNLPPNPGGYHCYYQVCCRNLSTTNVNASCNCIGASVSTDIPGPTQIWLEDFTLANGTTNDAGTTAWSRSLGTTPPGYAQVQNNLFEVQGANNAQATWLSQQINIAAYPTGALLQVALSENGNLEPNDSILTYYSINSGPFVPFTVNGAIADDFTAATATSGPVTGNTVQIMIRVHYDGSSPTSELYRWDNVLVYGNNFVSNSSPVFTAFPPLFLCQGNFFSFNHAASDADGDSLVYSFYTPYTDAAPTYANNVISFTPVTWLGGFSATNPLGGPPLSLNSSTGLLTGTPTMTGQFVVGVLVKEYRNGNFLNQTCRDFQFNVVFCPPPAQALIVPGDTMNACSGLMVTFPNNSTVNANNWFWNFGDGSTLADTSHLQYPTYTYPSPGTYLVTMITNKGTPCADTSYASVDVGFAIANFTSNAPQCAGTNVSFTNSSSCSANTTITGYSWNFGDSQTSTLTNPTHAYATGGTYTVTLITYTGLGCTDTLAIPITITPRPATPSPSSNSPVCTGATLNLTTSAVAGATYAWTGPNGFSSALQNPSISNVTAAAAGTYSLTVTVSGCTSIAGTTSVTVNPTPSAPTASSNSPLCVGSTLNLTASNIAGATYSWTGPNSFSSSSQNPSIVNATAAASGTYSVTATVGGCTSAAGTTAVTVSPAPAAPTASSNSPICAGSTLNLTASNIAGATYSWNGPNSFSSSTQNPSIPGATTAASGTYSVTATVAGCTGPAGTVNVTVSPAPAAPTASSNSPICSGNTLNLTASNIAGATYSWTGPNSFSSSTQNPSIVNATTAASGTYSVTATVAGCTGPAGTVAVTVNATPAAPTAGSNSPICAGSTLNLTASNIAGATYAWTGPNSFSSSTQNPSIPGATTAASGTYSVTATVAGCTSAFGTAAVTVNAIPAAPAAGSNSPICAGSTLNLTASNIAGATYSWAGPNSFSSSSQNPSIVNATTAASGTYSVTATVAGCTGSAGTVVVTVNPIPAAPTASSNSPICAGSTLNLSASNIAGATYSWTGPNSFTSSTQNPSIVNATTAASGTYSVTVSVNGCASTAATTAVTVNPTPATPAPSSNSPICIGQTLNLTTSAVAGATYSWTGPNSFSSSSQNPSIVNATAAASGTYSLVVTVNGCSSAAGTVAVAVNAPPSPPTAGSNSPVCSGSTLNLTASFIVGATYSWSGPNGFTSTLQNPSIVNVTTAASGTYTVTANNGCVSSPSTVVVVINPTPAAPTAGSNSPICAGSTLNLTASNIAGATYSWTGPNSFSSSSQNPSIPGATTAASGTYSVTATVGGCTSAAGTVAVTVNAIPAAPAAGSNSPICAGSTLNLTASNIAGATYSWTGPNSFSSSSQNPSIVNATTAASGTYSVTATVAGCTGSAGTVVVTVNPIPAAPTASSNSPICAGSTLNLSASNVAGATYSWVGPNLFFSTSQNPSIVSATTAASGTYSVTVSVNGCTSSAGTTAVTVNPIPATPAPSSNSPICVGQTLNLTTSAVAGATYSWTGPNSFSSSSQNPSIPGATAAASGTYSLVVTVNGCSSAVGTVNVSVNTPPAAPTAGSNSPVCSGSTLNLTASFIVGATYSWSGPNGFTSTLQNPSIVNVTTAASGTYTVTANNGCASTPSTVVVVVNPTPAAPTAGSNSPLCVGSTLNLTASNIAGATYSWTGPNSFSSSSQNPSIPNATTAESGTYSVTATVNGCTSAAGTVNVTVNPIPAAPAPSSNSPVCTGQTLNLTTSAVAGATYSWTGPNSFSSSSQNPNISNVSLAAAGTYSLTVTVLGCTSAPGTTTVVVNPTPAAPTASSNSPICDGSTLNLNASNVAGATYSWTGPNSFTDTQQNTSIPGATTAASGTYSVTATVNGCTSAAGTTSVIVNPIPATPAPSSNSPICVGQTLNLSTSAVAGATYSWTGPNSFSSSSQNPNIVNATAAASGTYTLIVTVNGCSSAIGTVTVAVNSTPVSPVASANSPVCVGSTLQLQADTIIGAIYSWTGPNGFTSTLQNPSIINVTAAAAGTYTVVANNGCSSSPATVVVVVNPTPATPSPTNNGPICAGSALNLSTTAVAGATYSWTGPNGYSSSSQNNSIPNAGTLQSGTYSLTITVNGCTSAAGTTNAVVDTLATISAGPDQAVCANNPVALLSASSSTGSGVWSTSGSGTFSPNNTTLNATYTASAADTLAGSVTLTFTSTNNGPCSAVNDQVIITITDAPSVDAGANQTVCANNATVSLNGTFFIASGIVWSSSGTGTFSPSNTAANASYIPSAADTAAGTVTIYISTTGNGGCLAANDSMIITITPAPIVNAGGNTSVCINNPNVSLNGSSGTGTGTWSTSGSGNFNPNPNTLNATYVPSAADLAAGTVTLVLSSTNNGNCLAVPDTMVVTFSQPPSVAAGSDMTVCANADTVLLSGTSSTGSGTWTSSGSGTFVPNANTLNATYIPSAADTAAGTVTLTLTSTNNGGCIAVNDQLVITITDAPTANAGADQSVCANNASVSLNGSVTLASGGSWITLGSGTFSPSANVLNPAYTPSAADTTAGTVTLVLYTTGNGTCNAATDTVVITITDAPTVNAGPNIISCINNPNTPLNGSSSTGSGTWTTLGSGTFSPNANVLNPTYIPSTADTIAGSVTLIFSSAGNGNCLAEDDTIIVQFAPVPVVTVGPDQTVCANNASVLLSASSSTGSGTWTTSGSGIFSPNANTMNATYIPSAADTAAGTVTLTFNAANACTPVSQSLVITITPAPYALGGPDLFTCADNPNATISAYVGGGSSTGTWTSSGSGSFSPNNSSLNVTYVPSAGDIIAGSVWLVLTSSNNGNCLAAVDSVLLTITMPPVAAAGPDAVACANNGVALSGTITGGNGTGIWSTPNGSGTFSPSNTSLNVTYTPTNADTAVSPVMIILTSTNNGGCFAASDTMYIQVNPGPEVIAGADITVCSNNANVNLNGSVLIATGGVWSSSGAGTFSPDSVTLNATYIPDTADISAGSVTLYLSSTGNGLCSAVTDSLLVSFSPSPVVNAGTSQTVCTGTPSVSLGGSVSGGASSGQWSTSGDGSFSPNDTTLNATYVFGTADTTAGTVTLYLVSTNNGTCLPENDSITITITPVPQTFAGNDTMVCANASAIVLNGQVIGTPGTGVWTTSGSGTFAPDSTALNATYTPSAADTASGTVTLVLTSTGACLSVSDTVLLSFAPVPTVSAGPDALICAGDVVSLSGLASNGSGLQWSTSGDGTFLPSDTVLNPVYVPGPADTASGTVTLTFTSAGNGFCSPSPDSMQITINSKPNALFSAGTICYNTQASFTDLSTVSNGSIVSWYWTAGADTSTLQNPGFVFSTTGTQTVSLVVTTPAGCADTTSMTVYVNPAPVPYYGSVITCPTDLQLYDSSTIAAGTISSWTWNLGDSTGSILQNPQYTYADTGMYIVTLTVTSDSGCVSSYSDTLVFIPCSEDEVLPPAVPTAFTPNGDGTNDILYVRGGPFSEFQFRVYNEWGNLIFSSGSQSTGWDGTFKSKEQPVGTYVWVLVGTMVDGTEINTTGEITLLR